MFRPIRSLKTYFFYSWMDSMLKNLASNKLFPDLLCSQHIGLMKNFITYACEACVCMCEGMHMHESSIL